MQTLPILDQVQVDAPTKLFALPENLVGAFAVGNVTPSVQNANYWLAQNTAPLIITNFTKGQDGQTIYILGDGFTTIAQNVNIQNASGNPTLLAKGVAYTYTRMSSVWYQLQGTGGQSASNGIGIKLVDWNFAAHIAPAAVSRAGWVASASASGADVPANAIDGNLATRWSTGAVVVPGTTYFELDMGVATLISAFQINNNVDTQNWPLTGNVQYSDDNITWVTTYSWTAANISNVTPAIITISFTASTHRYWRLLAESTPVVSTDWMSISEINGFATPYILPTWQVSNQAWQGGGLQAVWFKGVFARVLTGDVVGVGIGLNTSNMYALYYTGGSANILLVSVIAGVQTTLATIAIDNDIIPHEFEIELITSAGSGQNNWITARVGRGNNPYTSVGIKDSTLDFTTSATGIFTLLSTTDTVALGCNYFQLPSTTATDAQCTIATGGDFVYQDGNYRTHVFYNNGTFNITQAGIGQINVFVVGGGGGGNGQNGGGSGGYTQATLNITLGSVVVTIGAGGVGGSGPGAATDGGTSFFGGTGASGGGGGSTVGGGTAPGGFVGGTSTGVSGSCGAPSPCAAGFSAGGGAASFQSNGQSAVITNTSFNCPTGTCIATGTWGAGGAGTHLAIKNPNSVLYNGFDICYGGFGNGNSTGSGSVSGPLPGTFGGELRGWGGGGNGVGAGGPGIAGIVIIRYLYNPLKCG